MSRHPRTSVVWESFEPAIKNGKVISVTCIHCNKEYKYFGNTTNLRDHLKRIHPDQLFNPPIENFTNRSFDSDSASSSTVHSYQPPKRKRRSRNRTSFVWDFFTQTVQNGEIVSVTCKQCNQTLKCPRSTTNLHSHLRRNHSTGKVGAFDEEVQCFDDFQKSKRPNIDLPSAAIWKSFRKIYVNNNVVRVICKHCNNGFENVHDITNLLDHLERNHPSQLLEIQGNPNKPAENISVVQNQPLFLDNEINEIDNPFETISLLPDESSQTEKQFNEIEYFETITVFSEDSSAIRERTNEINETVTIFAEGHSGFGEETNETDETLKTVTMFTAPAPGFDQQTNEINEPLEAVTILAEGPSNLKGQTYESLKTIAIPAEGRSNCAEQKTGSDEHLETIIVYMDGSSEAGEQCNEIKDCFKTGTVLTEESLDIETQFNENDESINTTTVLQKKFSKTKTKKSLCKSTVWNSFHKIIRNEKISSAICKYCCKRYKYFGNTSNLYGHLKRLHPSRLKDQGDFVIIDESTLASTSNGISKIEKAKPGLRLSRVWQYFMKAKKSGKNIVLRCKQCNKIYNYCGNTSNLLQHLKNAHSIYLTKVHNQKNISLNKNEYLKAPLVEHTTEPHDFQLHGDKHLEREIENAENGNHSVSQALSFDLIPRSEPTKDEIKKFEKDLICMMAVDSQPLSLVENPGFRFFVGKYIPRYKLPSQKTLCDKVLPEVYRSLRDNFRTMLQQIENISITTDMWQSDSNKIYVTVTAHFVYEFKFFYSVLSTVEVKNHIADILTDLFTEWKITDKIVTVVTNNVASMEKSNLVQHCIPCIIHILNSSIQEAIKETKRLEAILSSFVHANLKEDNLAANIMKQFRRVKGLPVRCNFTFILETLSKMKESISTPVDDISIHLEKYESDAIDDFIQILKLLSLVIEDLSKEKYPTVPRTMLLIRGLQSEMKKMDATTDIGKLVKSSFCMDISRRFSFLEITAPIAKAIFLDPRFKIAAFTSQKAAGMAQDLVTNELSVLIRNSNEPIPWSSNPINNESELWSNFDKKMSAITSTITPEASAQLIIKTYLEMPYLDRKKDPLEFWKTHFNTFPKLFSLASKYLSIPGTSVPIDLVFNKDGVSIDDKRSRLPSKGLNEVLFISENIKSSNQKTNVQ